MAQRPEQPNGRIGRSDRGLRVLWWLRGRVTTIGGVSGSQLGFPAFVALASVPVTYES
jgi:hypothetical protein